MSGLPAGESQQCHLYTHDSSLLRQQTAAWRKFGAQDARESRLEDEFSLDGVGLQQQATSGGLDLVDQRRAVSPRGCLRLGDQKVTATLDGLHELNEWRVGRGREEI